MRRAVVVGGGIAGHAAATALARTGRWRVEVLEQAAAVGEVGAGLQMAPNACKVLRWLGVLDEVQARASRPRALRLCDGITGSTFFSAALGDGAVERWGAPYLHVHRADLVAALAAQGAAAATPVRTRLAAKVVGLEATHDGAGAAVRLEDGTVCSADLVVGADGIRSRLRAAISPEERAPRFTGQAAWRGLVPASAAPARLVQPEAVVWAGEGRHVVTYPVRGGELVNVVAVVERQGWAEEGWSCPGDTQRLCAAFEGWHPDLTALLRRLDPCFFWGIFDRPCDGARWSQGSVALVGDAAHPMVPFLAQGAGMALEDAAVLARRLEGSLTETGAAVAEYELDRRPRVRRVMRLAEANGAMYHQGPGLARTLARGRLAVGSAAVPEMGLRPLDALYSHDATRAFLL